MSRAMNLFPCKCAEQSAARRTRNGVIDQFLSVLGWYPWDCMMCGRHFYRRVRGRSRYPGRQARSTT